MPRDPNRQGGVRSAVTRLRVSKKKIVFYFCECPYRLGEKKKWKMKKRTIFFICVSPAVCWLARDLSSIFRACKLEERHQVANIKQQKLISQTESVQQYFWKTLKTLEKKKKKKIIWGSHLCRCLVSRGGWCLQRLRLLHVLTRQSIDAVDDDNGRRHVRILYQRLRPMNLDAQDHILLKRQRWCRRGTIVIWI